MMVSFVLDLFSSSVVLLIWPNFLSSPEIGVGKGSVMGCVYDFLSSPEVCDFLSSSSLEHVDVSFFWSG